MNDQGQRINESALISIPVLINLDCPFDRYDEDGGLRNLPGWASRNEIGAFFIYREAAYLNKMIEQMSKIR